MYLRRSDGQRVRNLEFLRLSSVANQNLQHPSRHHSEAFRKDQRASSPLDSTADLRGLVTITKSNLFSHITMAASIARLSAKRLCLRPSTLSKTSTPRVASAISSNTTRSFSAVASRQYATTEAYPGTKLVATNEHFSQAPNAPEDLNAILDEFDPEDMNKRSIRHYTVNFGPQHPAAHGVLRLILVRMGWSGKCALHTQHGWGG